MIPSTIILMSYFKTWLKWKENKRNLKNTCPECSNGNQDFKLGFSMLLICISFMAFSSLLIIYEVVLRNNSGTSTIFLCFYWLQFYSNFLIYTIWNEQYRKAFFFFLQNVVFCDMFCSQSPFKNKPIELNVVVK